MTAGELANTVAKYWSNHLRTGKSGLEDYKRMNVRDDEMPSATAALMGMTMTKSALSDKQADKFERCLYEIVKTNIISRQKRDPESDYLRIIFGTDYGPQGELADALRMSGTPSDSMPIKTMIWVNINDGKVSVSEGHGAEQRELTTIPE